MRKISHKKDKEEKWDRKKEGKEEGREGGKRKRHRGGTFISSSIWKVQAWSVQVWLYPSAQSVLSQMYLSPFLGNAFAFLWDSKNRHLVVYQLGNPRKNKKTLFSVVSVKVTAWTSSTWFKLHIQCWTNDRDWMHQPLHLSSLGLGCGMCPRENMGCEYKRAAVTWRRDMSDGQANKTDVHSGYRDGKYMFKPGLEPTPFGS